MITNWLLDHPWATTVGLVVLLLLGPPFGAVVARRPRLAWWAAGTALVPVAALTMAPAAQRIDEVRCAVQWSLPSLSSLELMANVLLFVPPALLATVAGRRPWLVLLAGSGLSAAIEAVQAVATGIGRACDTTDWTSNTLGTAAGVLLGCLALALHRSRTTGTVRTVGAVVRPELTEEGPRA